MELVGAKARIEFPANANAGFVPLAWPKDVAWSGPRPFVRVSRHAELVETAASAQGQALPPGQVGVSGRLSTPFEEDRYRVPVTPGTKMKFEVFAERYGSPIDTALVIRDEKGVILARADDGPGTSDPVLEYVVPEKRTSIIVGVVDAQGQGGPRGIYHLVVKPISVKAMKKDFAIVTQTQRVALLIKGRTIVPIFVERNGYAGPIELVADRLPKGTRSTGTTIPPEAAGRSSSSSATNPRRKRC